MLFMNTRYSAQVLQKDTALKYIHLVGANLKMNADL